MHMLRFNVHLVAGLFLCLVASRDALAAGPIMGVNVVAVDQQMTDEQWDALIERLRQSGVTTIRTALGGHGERYTQFVIEAFRRGIGSIVMLNVYAGNNGQHTAPADPSVGRQWPQ